MKKLSPLWLRQMRQRRIQTGWNEICISQFARMRSIHGFFGLMWIFDYGISSLISVRGWSQMMIKFTWAIQIWPILNENMPSSLIQFGFAFDTCQFPFVCKLRWWNQNWRIYDDKIKKIHWIYDDFAFCDVRNKQFVHTSSECLS